MRLATKRSKKSSTRVEVDSDSDAVDSLSELFTTEPEVDADVHILFSRAYVAMRTSLEEVGIDPDSEPGEIEYESERDRLYHFALPLLSKERGVLPANEWRPHISDGNWDLESYDSIRASADV